MFKEYLKISVKNLRTRQLRSWLTILGIVIGVFLIMSLLSLSQGLRNAILGQLKAVGTDVVFIAPGTDLFANIFGGTVLTKEDLNVISKTAGVAAVIPDAYKAELMRYGGENKTVLLFGMDIKNSLDIYIDDLGTNLAQGRWPAPGRKELVVGSSISKNIFPNLKIGGRTTINGKDFEIVGILESRGNQQDDSSVGLDLDVFYSVTGSDRNEAPRVIAKVAKGYAASQVAKTIEYNLEQNAKKRRGQSGQDAFSVLTSDSLAGMVNNVLGIVQAAIIAFASIAILVGGIGIMNTMYTSVRERTKEIGILKAIGAKGSTIISIFLIEAGIIGLMGGLGGMILGLGLAKTAAVFGGNYIQASITPGIIAFGLLFSITVGCASGFFPARSASRLKPVDALRYE